MANDLYAKGRQRLLTAQLDLSSGTYKVAALSAAYTFSGAHEFRSDLTGVVATSGSLTSLAVSGGKWSAANPTFTAATGNPIIALAVFKDTGLSSTSPLVCYIDSDPTGVPLNVFPTGIDLPVVWPASGILNI